jgi:hypothetical protein
MTDILLRQVERLNRLVRARRELLQDQEDAHQRELEQMLRFGICPCIVQGRYSTCCATKLGDDHG